MRRAGLLASALTIVVLAVALLPATPAPASSGFVAACAATPLMNNVPRGGEIDVEWEMCVMTNGHGSWDAQVKLCGAGAPRANCVGGRCDAKVPGRLHVELSVDQAEIDNSREDVLPTTCKPSSLLSTGWHSRAGGGWYCASLWNHDAGGFYKVVPGEVSLGGDRESATTDIPRASRGQAAAAPHVKAANKWKSVCLYW